MRWENAAPILAKQMGWKSITVHPSLKEDVVYIRSVDATREELLQKIQKTLNVTFESRSDGIWLTQSTEQKRAEQAFRDEFYRNMFSLVVQRGREKASALPEFNDAFAKSLVRESEKLQKMEKKDTSAYYRQVENLGRKSPFSRLLYRLAFRIKVEHFAGLTRENPRIVYSNRPTKMQKPLPFAIDDLIQQFRHEQEVWSNYAGADKDEESGSEYFGSLSTLKKPINQRDIHTILMIFDRNQYEVPQVKIFDFEGKELIRQGLSEFDSNEEGIEEEFSIENYRTEIKKFVDEAPAITKEFLELQRSAAKSKASVKLSPQLRQVLENLETQDVLSITQPYLFRSKLGNRNVVANLTDDNAFRSSLQLKIPKNYPVAFRDFLPEVNDRWYCEKAINALDMRESRMPRKQLGDLMRFFIKNPRRLTLEEICSIRASLPKTEGFGSNSDYTYMSLFQMLGVTSRELDYGGTGARIFGSMSEDYRKEARKPNGLAFSQLPAKTQTEILKAVFQGNEWESRIELDYEMVSGLPDTQQTKIFKENESMGNGLKSEKTVFFANGFPQNARFTIVDDSQDVLICSRPTGSEYGTDRTMSPEELGTHLFRKQFPKKYPWEDQQYNTIDENSIQIGTRRTVLLKILLDPAYYCIQWGLQESYPKSETVYSAKNLPSAILKEIQKGYEQAKKDDVHYQEGQFGGNGNKRVPPPVR